MASRSRDLIPVVQKSYDLCAGLYTHVHRFPRAERGLHELKNLADDELLRRLSELVQRSRRIEVVLVAHIAEVDARRLYIRDAPSMFVYCTQVLHLSEHEAYARITAARASRRHPVLLAMLHDGRLHLSGIGKLAPHLTDANAADVLARAAHRTKAQIEELVAEIAPKPDVPAAIRKVPVRHAAATAGQLGPDRVGLPGDALPLLAPMATGYACRPVREPDAPARPASPAPAGTTCDDERPNLGMPLGFWASMVTPLAPARYKVQLTASTELRDKLERLQALLRQDLATAIEAAVTETLARLEARRFGVIKTPRKSLDDTDTAPRSRYLPAAVRRLARERDGDQCTFLLRDGSRCPERRGLEFHHRHPYGRGGAHDPGNVGLMCRQHNAYVAELDYGTEHMERYRRPGDRVSEGALVRYGSMPGARQIVFGSR